jgi:hypothetical protein
MTPQKSLLGVLLTATASVCYSPLTVPPDAQSLKVATASLPLTATASVCYSPLTVPPDAQSLKVAW